MPAEASAMRPTRARVDLAALAHNLAAVRAAAAGSQVYGVVKADAYGHGLVEVARTLEGAGVDGLCVALAEEGLSLRAAGVKAPLLVLNGAYGDAHDRVLSEGLTPVAYSSEQLAAFAAAAGGGERVGVHLKVDTGMARLGVEPARLAALLDAMPAAIRIDGVMTHLSSADSDDAATREQLARFEEALRQIRSRGHAPTLVHAANSAATFNYPGCRFDMVRAGIALYGVRPAVPTGAEPDAAEGTLRPVMSLRSEVIAVRELSVGESVGYDRTFTATRPSRIATVPIGYGDGLLRAASNRASMLVRGQPCPVAGRVSMDLTSLDVTDLPGCEVGDEVVVLGEQQGAVRTAEQLAADCGTISYEVLTAISQRVPRTHA
ncbi:MAG: alanine racemase [Myxococcales bacterium]|nr:alanine racemase [Myxococcales bacterium]